MRISRCEKKFDTFLSKGSVIVYHKKTVYLSSLLKKMYRPINSEVFSCDFLGTS